METVDVPLERNANTVETKTNSEGPFIPSYLRVGLDRLHFKDLRQTDSSFSQNGVLLWEHNYYLTV